MICSDEAAQQAFLCAVAAAPNIHLLDAPDDVSLHKVVNVCAQSIGRYMGEDGVFDIATRARVVEHYLLKKTQITPEEAYDLSEKINQNLLKSLKNDALATLKKWQADPLKLHSQIIPHMIMHGAGEHLFLSPEELTLRHLAFNLDKKMERYTENSKEWQSIVQGLREHEHSPLHVFIKHISQWSPDPKASEYSLLRGLNNPSVLFFKHHCDAIIQHKGDLVDKFIEYNRMIDIRALMESFDTAVQNSSALKQFYQNEVEKRLDLARLSLQSLQQGVFDQSRDSTVEIDRTSVVAQVDLPQAVEKRRTPQESATVVAKQNL